MRRRPEFTPYTEKTVGFLFSRRAFVVFTVAVAVVGAMIGLSIGWHTRQHVKVVPVDVKVVQLSTPNCHPQLLAHDLAVLARAYDLSIGHHPRQALDEVGKNYAAIGLHECTPKPAPHPEPPLTVQ